MFFGCKIFKLMWMAVNDLPTYLQLLLPAKALMPFQLYCQNVIVISKFYQKLLTMR